MSNPLPFQSIYLTYYIHPFHPSIISSIFIISLCLQFFKYTKFSLIFLHTASKNKNHPHVIQFLNFKFNFLKIKFNLINLKLTFYNSNSAIGKNYYINTIVIVTNKNILFDDWIRILFLHFYKHIKFSSIFPHTTSKKNSSTYHTVLKLQIQPFKHKIYPFKPKIQFFKP